MKRFLTILLIAALTAGVFSACGAGEPAKQPDIEAVAEALKDGIDFETDLSELPEDELSYYITMEDGVSGVMYVSTGSTAEEIAVFVAPDKATAGTMLANVREYLKAQRSSFADYLPKEAKRIDDALVEQVGCYTVLCVSAQTDTAKQIVSDQFE